MSTFSCPEEYVDRLIMGFLRRRGYTDTLTAFELDSGVNESALGESLSYLKKLVLTGRWDDAMTYLTPLKGSVSDFGRTEFVVRRQQFLEALSWHGAGGHPKWSLAWSPHHDGLGDGQSMDKVVTLLKGVEGKCSAPEFDSLCLCLTLEDIRENADFSAWSVAGGRLECFEELRSAIGNLVEGENAAPSFFPGLETHIAMGLETQQAFAGAAAGGVTFRDGLIGLGDVKLKRSELPGLHVLSPQDGGPVALVAGSASNSSVPASPSRSVRMPPPASPTRSIRGDAPLPPTPRHAAAAAAAAAATTTETQGTANMRKSQEPQIKPRAPVSWTVGFGDGGLGSEAAAALPEPPMLSRGRPNVTMGGARDKDAAPGSPTHSHSYSPAQNMDSVAMPKPIKIFQADQPVRCVVGMDRPGKPYAGETGFNRRPEAITVAVGCNDKSLRVVSWEKGVGCTPLSEYADAHKGSVYGVDFHADGEVLATCSNDKSLRLYAPRRANYMSAPLRGHTGTVRAVKFAPTEGAHGMLLASVGAGDCRPRIWDVKTETCLFMAEPHAQAVHGVCWYDANVLLTGCEAGQVIATDMRMSARAWAMTVLGADDGLPHSICTLDCQGDLVALGTPMGCVDVVSASQRMPLVQTKLHTADVRCAAFQPAWGGEAQYPVSLLVGSFDGAASVCDVGPSVQSGKMRVQTRHRYLSHSDKVLGASWLPGRRAVTSGADGSVLLWTS